MLTHQIKYYVNPEKRVVTCVIYNTKNAIFDFLDINSKLYEFIWALSGKERAALELPDSFNGVARCAEQDEFNEELGKRIAYHKARDKYDHAFFKRANFFVGSLDKHLGELMQHYNRYGEKISGYKQTRLEALAEVMKS